MAHICARCGAKFDDARDLQEGCPACGCGRFLYQANRRGEDERVKAQEREQEASVSETPRKWPDHQKKTTEPNQNEQKTDEYTGDSPESIRIIEPGKYDLNLLRLAESDDRVIRVGSDETFRLDLHSMVRDKKKKK